MLKLGSAFEMAASRSTRQRRVRAVGLLLVDHCDYSLGAWRDDWRNSSIAVAADLAAQAPPITRRREIPAATSVLPVHRTS